MKSARVLSAILAVLLAAPALAGDGNVSPAVLKQLGLGGMEVVSDEVGMQVRGMGGNNAGTIGHNFVLVLVFDPSTASFATGFDAQWASAFAENAGVDVPTEVFQAHQGTAAAAVVNGNTGFFGIIVGGSGGFGNAGAH
jgi:hypothetical protein